MKTALLRQYIVKVDLHENIKILDNVFKGFSFLDNGRKLIPVRIFYSTALFIEMNQNSQRIMHLSAKSKIPYVINSLLCFGLFLIDFMHLFVWGFLFGLSGFFVSFSF